MKVDFYLMLSILASRIKALQVLTATATWHSDGGGGHIIKYCDASAIGQDAIRNDSKLEGNRQPLRFSRFIIIIYISLGLLVEYFPT